MSLSLWSMDCLLNGVKSGSSSERNRATRAICLGPSLRSCCLSLCWWSTPRPQRCFVLLPWITKSDRSAATHCKKTPTKTATPMSCCGRTPVAHSGAIAKGSAACCQMRAPFPGQSRSTPPANSSEEFKLQTHSQLLAFIGAASFIGVLPFAWASSTITFCPIVLITPYPSVSTFRI